MSPRADMGIEVWEMEFKDPPPDGRNGGKGSGVASDKRRHFLTG